MFVSHSLVLFFGADGGVGAAIEMDSDARVGR